MTACTPAKHYQRKNIAVTKDKDTLIIALLAVSALFHEKKRAFVLDDGGNQYRSKESILLLEKYLDSAVFFRINRNWVINRNFIKNISMNITGKAEILMNIPGKALTLWVSPKRAKRFRCWLNIG